MKNIVLLAILSVALFSCKKKLTEFFIENTSTATIPAASAVISTPFNVMIPDTEANFEQDYESNDTKKKYIDELKLNELTLEIKSPDNFTFSFLDEIELFIESPSQPETRIAYKFEIPDNIENKLVCDIDDKDLAAYIKDESYSLRLRTVTDEAFSQDVEIDIYTKFFVKAKLF